MHLSGLLSLLETVPAFADLDAARGSERPPQALLSAARPFVTAGLTRATSAPLLLLCATQERASRLLEQLQPWLPEPAAAGTGLYLFAEPDAFPYERIPWSDVTRQRRLTALTALQSQTGPAPVVVASARAVMQKTLPPRELRLALRPISVGGPLRLDEQTLFWVQSGYTPVEVVEEPGCFARRGGIVDIWPPNLPHPIRIDLFGDEVETLRLFDPTTQRTLQRLQRAEIGPGSEALAKYGSAALTRLGLSAALADPPATAQGPSPLQDPALLLTVREALRQESEQLQLGHSFRGIEWYLPYLYSRPASLLDYLPPGGRLLVDDAGELVAEWRQLEERAAVLRTELLRSGELPAGFQSSIFGAAELTARLQLTDPLLLGLTDETGRAANANTPLARAFVPGPRYAGKIKEIGREVARLVDQEQRVVLVTRQAARIQEQLEQAQITAHVQVELPQLPPPRSITLIQGALTEGFVLRSGSNEKPGGLYLLTDTELFGWSKPVARKRTHHQSKIAAELFFADVKPGDFVVHMEHGIGLYEGLVTLQLHDVEREYLQVSYALNDKLYVPVHQADRLSRYVGSETAPTVSRLGTADWQLVKERARKAVADIADDLLKLYAERELAHGYAYAPDGLWQEELEASFPYQETEDQLAAIEAVKQDLESPQPMDRLICGDVGYGKTEVGIRAAFKVVVEGKQVAVLVPTTVLAQQHFRTFSSRLAHFPVQVEMMSRFRTPAEQERVRQGLLDGSIDLVIGTHRLLSEDITFKELGLLIIDEEQRFGVAHKEKLKQLRTQVDVLTLSATPIPRTLHMSLSGIRDMTTISTPPRERLPVHTILSEYDELLVRQAIDRELERGGQVFFVHNRIRGINQIAARVQHLVPQAVVAVGHGQMAERQLEEAMLRFADGDIDVLVSTTIVENGLDISNANTIIINRADKFGLAQLYQLRGRVGRSAQRGYCYLLYDRHKDLTFDARRRLSALMESSEELGAGFRIAMRDLEIRGAGELLGAKQHGQIATVGFDLYTRLLTQAINEAKRRKDLFEAAQRRAQRQAAGAAVPPTLPGHESRPQLGADQEPPPPFDLDAPLAPPVTLDLPLVAAIPSSYIPEESLRLQLYRRIAGMSHVAEIDTMRAELLDRFGSSDPKVETVPEEVDNLLYQIRVKILALKADVHQIGRRLDQLAILPHAMEKLDRRQLQQRLRLHLGRLADDDRFVPNQAIHVGNEGVYLPIDEAGRWRSDLLRALELMAATLAEQRAAAAADA